MRLKGVCYRGHNPRFADEPMSGRGAALAGGRFNPVGREALYLALSLPGILVELTKGFGHFDPLLIYSYDVDVDDIVDLSDDAARAAEGVALADLACPWLLDLAKGAGPPRGTSLTASSARGRPASSCRPSPRVRLRICGTSCCIGGAPRSRIGSS